MPHNEATVFMEKHSKHESPAVGNSSSSSTNNTNSNTNREGKSSSPVFLVPAKKNDSPLYKYQGQKWEQVFDFDKMLKQIRNAERYYLRGRTDCGQSNGGKGSGSTGNFVRRVQPQVQRLNAGDMHFYGMVPKKPSDVVVCDICLGIYTKMGFNNHMRLHHTQAWNSVSSKSATPSTSSKDTAYHSSSSGGANNNDNNQEITREINASGNPLAESTANATPTATSSANNSRHKSSKSGSSGGSRSRSKSKHHHHHHQTSSSSASNNNSSSNATSSNAVTAASTAQTATANTELPSSHVTSSSKSSKKGTSSLNTSSSSTDNNKQNHSVAVPKEEPATAAQTPTLQTSSSSSLPATPKVSSAEITGLPDNSPIPPSKPAAKEKSKASKRKSKNSSAAVPAPVVYAAPEINESSNSSMEFSSIASNASGNSKSSKRSSKAKSSGKDLKQLLEPQLSELDQAVSSITGGQIEVSNENTSSNDRVDTIAGTAVANSTMSLNATENGNLVQMALPTATRQSVQQAQPQFGGMQILQDANINLQQQQPSQLQQQNSNDNDSSILILDDEIDSKFIHEILNTDESEIHFDESELDRAAAVQQQPQQTGYMPQPTPSKRMRYDQRLTTNEHGAQQPEITGKFAAFQHQQQQQQQQPFHVANLDDIKMYTTAIDGQQYLSAQPSHHQQQQQQHHHHNHHQQPNSQDQHQITTIDTLQLQQLLYQQQQQQLQPGLTDFALDELNAATNSLEQQQFNNADVIMCSAEQLHKEGKINADDYATLTALNNNDAYGSVPNNICNVNAAAAAAAAQFQVYNIPSLTDDDVMSDSIMENKLNNVIVPQNHYVLSGDGNDEEQLIYEITANNQVALISQQRQQQMIAEFLTQAGYDNVENVNMNINASGNAMITTEPTDTKPIINVTDPTDELLDFDFSRLETVTSVSSSSTSESKSPIKIEPQSDKYMSTAALPDDMFLNVFLYAGLPRPLALNSFGLVKLPQSVATTFRKNLHATRKANNSPVYSLSGSGSPAVRFGTNPSNAKSSAAQSYFTALGANSSSGAFNEFSNIGSITITNQSSASQQQLAAAAQKQNSHNDLSFNATSSNVNGLLAAAGNATSPSMRPKSASNKQPPSSSGVVNSSFQLPQSQPKTIFVNTNLAAAPSNADKFIKRSLISKTSPLRSGSTFTAKQLSDILLHPGKDSKEKHLQLLTTREQDKDGAIEQQQQRLDHVKSFYERRKKLMNATAHAASTNPGYNQARLINTQPNSSSSSSTALKQKLLRERLLRTLSDCGINSIKSNSSSPNNAGGNDILRVLA